MWGEGRRREGAHQMESAFTIVTPRLRLYAPSLSEIHELIRGERAELGERIGAAIPREWPNPHLTEALPIIAEAMEQEPGDARWVWMVIEPITARVIGDIGFHGPPRAGATIELGYVLTPDAQGYGYATEAASALIHWTFARTGVAEIIAQIDPANVASLRVAAKIGMRERPPVLPGLLCFGISSTPA